MPAEAAWATFPARVDESPLRVSNLVLQVGGAWDPVGLTYEGGYTLAEEIASIDAGHRLGQLHLNAHLTPQRSNGLMAMVKRIKADAETVLSQRTLH